ncbi:MAG: hypothetical protein LBB56_01695, partial [Chitinispirillales bacterium]|nr:hypothetical protein [Chitinispirillales bacterium]
MRHKKNNMRQTTKINNKNASKCVFILFILIIISANINAQPIIHDSQHAPEPAGAIVNEYLWEEPPPKEKIPVLEETSKFKMSEGVNYYSLEIKELTHLSVKASAEAAAVLFVNNEISSYEEFGDLLSWDIPLKPGRYTLGIKPLTERTLSGVSLSIGFYPVNTLTEKNPFGANMESGQTVMLKFNLNKQSRIGLGLAMSKQTVRVALLDEKGIVISEGRQLFTTLEKGIYYVKLSVAPFLDGTDIKLYLFGQENITVPPTEELVRWIVRSSPGERPQLSSFKTDNSYKNSVSVLKDNEENSGGAIAEFALLKIGNNEYTYTLSPSG